MARPRVRRTGEVREQVLDRASSSSSATVRRRSPPAGWPSWPVRRRLPCTSSSATRPACSEPSPSKASPPSATCSRRSKPDLMPTATSSISWRRPAGSAVGRPMLFEVMYAARWPVRPGRQAAETAGAAVLPPRRASRTGLAATGRQSADAREAAHIIVAAHRLVDGAELRGRWPGSRRARSRRATDVVSRPCSLGSCALGKGVISMESPGATTRTTTVHRVLRAVAVAEPDGRPAGRSAVPSHRSARFGSSSTNPS